MRIVPRFVCNGNYVSLKCVLLANKQDKPFKPSQSPHSLTLSLSFQLLTVALLSIRHLKLHGGSNPRTAYAISVATLATIARKTARARFAQLVRLATTLTLYRAFESLEISASHTRGKPGGSSVRGHFSVRLPSSEHPLVDAYATWTRHCGPQLNER